MPDLRAHDIHLSIGGARILESVSVDVDESGVVGLVGPNGAGKTTLFNVICGLAKPRQGTVSINGRDVTKLSPDRRAACGLSRTFQNLQLYDDMTVLENVMVGRTKNFPRGLAGAALAGVLGNLWPAERRARESALATLESLGIAGDAQRTVSELPFGRRRLVDLARALSADPAVLLLDEPFSGLSVQEKTRMVETLSAVRRARDLAVLVVEHDMDVISEFCTTMVVLNSGRIIATGVPADVLQREEVKDAYLGRQLERVVRRRSR